MNRLQNFDMAEVVSCVNIMVKFVIGGGYTEPIR